MPGSGERPAPIIGREAGLARLRGLVDPAPQASQVLVVTGEAGMGKAALLEYMAARRRICARSGPWGWNQRWSWRSPVSISCARRCSTVPMSFRVRRVRNSHGCARGWHQKALGRTVADRRVCG